MFPTLLKHMKNYLFRKEGGASSLLAVNITTKTGTGDNENINTELTTAKLESALKKIKGEDFHILFIADTVNDAGLTMINTFLEESSEIKRPNGLIIPLTRDNDLVIVFITLILNNYLLMILN